MPSELNITGQVFGNWTVLSKAQKATVHSHSTAWKCQCICGRTKVRLRTNLIAGKNRGCGCTPWNVITKPFESLYRVFLKAAKKKNHKVEISYQDFLAFVEIKLCHYCGAQVTWAEYSTNRLGNNYNLDRKDNNLGYTKDNCVVCCSRCNRAKSNHFTYEEWVQIGKLIRSWQ